MARLSSYRLHKASGQGCTTIRGIVYYFGPFKLETSKAKFRKLLAEYLSTNLSPAFGTNPRDLTMAELTLAYLAHAETYYTVKSTYDNLERACKPVEEIYADLPAKDFGVLQFRTCRDWWLNDPKRSRGYVNEHAGRLLRILKWAVGQGMIPPSIFEACKCVESLKAGRCTASEPKKVTCVPQNLVDATLPHLTQVVCDMVRFQQLVGCRPGELCKITPSLVDRSEDVWQIRLPKHKTAYLGKDRTLYVGPQAQAILCKYLLRAENAACFSPIESEKQRLEAKHDARVTPLNCGNKPGSNRVRTPRRTPGTAFDTGSYAHSIKGACKRAFPAPKELSDGAKKQWQIAHAWAPNQLRHNAATTVRKKFGLEGAQVILGHSDIGISQVYAEIDASKAMSIARQIG